VSLPAITHSRDLKRVIRQIDRRLLDDNLNNLIKSGFIAKTFHSVKPIEVYDAVKEPGTSLVSVLEWIIQWGEVCRTELEKVIER